MTGNIVWLMNHARASALSRDARPVKASEVSPAPRARSVDKIADHLSAGMLLRCHHLETVGARQDTSEAMASFEGQSSITSRKERKSAIAEVLGQFVLKRKDVLALDGKLFSGHNVPMADDSKDQYHQSFIERVREARIATGLKQWQIADGLGVKQDYYKHFEVLNGEGRLMPHHLIQTFCLLCRVNMVWLMTGTGPKAWKPLEAVESMPDTAVPKSKRGKSRKAAAA